MKRSTLLLVCVITFYITSYSQTPGTLTVTATTSNAGGNYQPKNIVAIWIEDDQGHFVKTLLAYAQTRRQWLNIWEAATTAAGSAYNTADAISGPTRSNHSTHTCTWDGTDLNGALVADGSYKLWMELTDKHATGNYSSFTITKGIEPEYQTPANVPSFASILINWEPVLTSVEEPRDITDFQAIPNPSSGKFIVSGQGIREINVYNLTGNLAGHSMTESVDIKDQPDGVYFLQISSDQGIFTKKIVKNRMASSNH